MGPPTLSSQAIVVALALGVALCSGCQPPPTSVVPPWCTPRAELDARCEGAHCVAAIVIDYLRLDPRGYRIFSLSGAAVDSAAAVDRSRAFIINERGAPAPDFVDAIRSGDFYVCFASYATNHNEWLVVVHAESGQVLFAEPQLWADVELRGYDFPLPASFAGPEALGCTDQASEPQRLSFVSTGAPYQGALSEPRDAWEVVARLNLTEEFAGPRYRAMVVSYAPAIGEFDAEAADWYVWINRLQ